METINIFIDIFKILSFVNKKTFWSKQPKHRRFDSENVSKFAEQNTNSLKFFEKLYQKIYRLPK